MDQSAMLPRKDEGTVKNSSQMTLLSVIEPMR
jgi:hypothetical protein